MIWKDRYHGIVITEKEIRNQLGNYSNIEVEDNVIESIDVNVIAHFGNTVGIEMNCRNISPLPLYNNTGNIGYIVRLLVDLLDKNNEDGTKLQDLVGTPLRIAFLNGRAAAIGHKTKDEFVLINSLMSLRR